jgi:hypothetical protein
MPYEQDLFISYAHIDNQPLTAEQLGWVTRFHATLAAQLSMRLGTTARIWRDDKLRGNDVFADEIVQQFARTALMLSVLTPRYLASDWCRREIGSFCDQAQRHGGLAPGNKARVFKVVKTPVDTQDALPPTLRDTLGYPFYVERNGAPLELDPDYGPEFKQGYLVSIALLAHDLAQLLAKLQGEPAANDAPPPADAQRPAVYLAECSADRREARTALEAELKLHGVRVLPDRVLPRDDEASYVAAVTEQLARCALSIHLVGTLYGAVPDGADDKSISVLQNELAARRCRAGGLTRLIWLPEGTSSTQPQQQAFIRRLLEDDDAQFGADVLTGDLETLKAAMHATLKKLDQPPPAPPAAADKAAPLVYLVCDERDRKATLPLRRWLIEQGLEVALPAFGGAAAEVREANERVVARCDALLLYYGAGDEAWKRTTDTELAKCRGLRGGRALPRFTYLAAPDCADKVDLVDLGEPGLIDGRAGFAADQLQPLRTALDAQAAAAGAAS